jgi:hypothetical protein
MERVPCEFLAFALLFVLIRDPRESNPVLDLRFWTLVQSILSSLSSKSLKTGLSHNAWLIPLLNRVPLLPIVSSLLSNSLNLPAQKRGTHGGRVPSFRRRVKHHSRTVSAFLGTWNDVSCQAALAMSILEGPPCLGGSVGALRARTKHCAES